MNISAGSLNGKTPDNHSGDRVRVHFCAQHKTPEYWQRLIRVQLKAVQRRNNERENGILKMLYEKERKAK